MFDGAFTALERVVEAGVNLLGLEVLAIMLGFGGVIGVVLGITAVRRAREIGAKENEK